MIKDNLHPERELIPISLSAVGNLITSHGKEVNLVDESLMNWKLAEIIDSWDEEDHDPTPDEEAVVSILLLIENHAEDILILSNKYGRADSAAIIGFYALDVMQRRGVPQAVRARFMRKLHQAACRLFDIPQDEMQQLMKNRLGVFSSLIRNAKNLTSITDEAALLFSYDIHYNRYVDFFHDSPVILMDFSTQSQILMESKTFFGAVFPLILKSVDKFGVSAPQPSAQPASQPLGRPAPASPTRPKSPGYSNSKDRFYGCLPIFLCPVLFVAVLLFALFTTGGGSASPKETAPGETVQQVIEPAAPKLNPVSTPANGHVFERMGLEALAPFSVTAPSGSGIYVVLDPYSFSGCTEYQDTYSAEYLSSQAKKAELRFFVRGGSTVEMDVPLGKYHVYYATGDTWYGAKHLFGPDTRYYKCDSTFDFTSDDEGYNGWTLTLTAVYNGNLDTDQVDAEDFPK